jgi:hypothetical protein
MWFGVLPAERVKLFEVSGVYIRLLAEYLVNIGNMLLVPASFGWDSCCIWPKDLSVGYFSFWLAFVGSERWSFRSAVVDDNLVFMEVRGCKNIG